VRSGAGQHARAVGHSGEAASLRSQAQGAVEAVAGVGSSTVVAAASERCSSDDDC
jgi:hypothetical protein